MTNKPELKASLRELAASDNRSQAKKLRDVFDDVEAALAAGASRETVHAELVKAGFTLSLRSFDQAMYRIRNKVGGKKVAQPMAASPVEQVESATLDAPIPDNRGKKLDNYFQKSNPLKGKKV